MKPLKPQVSVGDARAEDDARQPCKDTSEHLAQPRLMDLEAALCQAAVAHHNVAAACEAVDEGGGGFNRHREVRIREDGEVPLRHEHAGLDRLALAGVWLLPDDAHARTPRRHVEHGLARAVGRAVVDEDYFVGQAEGFEEGKHVRKRAGEALTLVICGNHERDAWSAFAGILSHGRLLPLVAAKRGRLYGSLAGAARCSGVITGAS